MFKLRLSTLVHNVYILAVCNPPCLQGKGRCVSPNTCKCSNPSTGQTLTCGQCKKLYHKQNNIIYYKSFYVIIPPYPNKLNCAISLVKMQKLFILANIFGQQSVVVV